MRGQYLLALIREWGRGLALIGRTAYIWDHEEIGLYTTATWCVGAVLIGRLMGVRMWLDFDGSDSLQGRTNEAARIRLYTTATWCAGAVLIGRLMGVGYG